MHPQEQGFTYLDLVAPWPFPLPAGAEWVSHLADTKDEFEVDDAIATYSTWREIMMIVIS